MFIGDWPVPSQKLGGWVLVITAGSQPRNESAVIFVAWVHMEWSICILTPGLLMGSLVVHKHSSLCTGQHHNGRRAAGLHPHAAGQPGPPPGCQRADQAQHRRCRYASLINLDGTWLMSLCMSWGACLLPA